MNRPTRHNEPPSPASHAVPSAHASIELPAYATNLISLIEKAGFEAWCVGGFVRDSLLGRASHDVDLATNAAWTDVQRLCEQSRLRTRATGVKHGTITVVCPAENPEDAQPHVEVTTYRVDGAYKDARHPQSVDFVRTIEEDLARRDFTMNALAYHPDRGLLDPYGGLADIESGIIRTVGNPATRFSEDALRILRACRFSSQLGFSIEPDTYADMLSYKNLLRKVSVERITDELDRLLLGDHVHDALMNTVDVLSFVVPELTAMKNCPQKTPYHIYDVLEHTAYVIAHAPATRLARWTALCHDMGKPAAAFFDKAGIEHFYGHAAISCTLASGLLSRLNMSAKFKEDVLKLVKHHDDVIEPDARHVKRALMRLGGRSDLFLTLCDIKQADALSQAPSCAPRAELANELKAILGEVLRNEEAFSLKSLAINGNDLLALGIPQGPLIGRVLNAALEAVVDGETANDRESLLAFVRSMKFDQGESGSSA